MKSLFFIGAGSFLGGIFRYLISEFIQTKYFSAFPYGTLTVNIAGCFLIGIIYGLNELFILQQDLRLFLATGLLGGFTTFSAFSNETVSMLRDGQFETALVYVLVSVTVGLLSTFFGISLTKLI